MALVPGEVLTNLFYINLKIIFKKCLNYKKSFKKTENAFRNVLQQYLDHYYIIL